MRRTDSRGGRERGHRAELILSGRGRLPLSTRRSARSCLRIPSGRSALLGASVSVLLRLHPDRLVQRRLLPRRQRPVAPGRQVAQPHRPYDSRASRSTLSPIASAQRRTIRLRPSVSVTSRMLRPSLPGRTRTSRRHHRPAVDHDLLPAPPRRSRPSAGRGPGRCSAAGCGSAGWVSRCTASPSVVSSSRPGGHHVQPADVGEARRGRG